jgi:hypothetical protein
MFHRSIFIDNRCKIVIVYWTKSFMAHVIDVLHSKLLKQTKKMFEIAKGSSSLGSTL